MSRSSLQRNEAQNKAANSIPVPQLNQPQQMYGGYYPGYPGYQGFPYPVPTQMVPMPVHNGIVQPAQHYNMNPTLPHVPLRGDDEDYDEKLKKSNMIPIHGNQSNFNINSLLYQNIMENDYFKALFQLRTYHEVMDEITRTVRHVEPWQTGTSRFPSSAFCLLFKFLLMKLTVKQMNGLLTYQGCPFVRAIGFIYLRYVCAPKDLWKWYEPYLEDEEEIQPASDKGIKMSMGSYCIKLLTDMQYYGTTLPRIPVPIERKIKAMLFLLDEKKNRRKSNMRLKEKGFFNVGDKVKAIYSDDQNEPAWYNAVIDSIDEENDNKFWVTFPEYGNSECVDLGEMEIEAKDSHRQRSNSSETREERSRRRSNSRYRQRHDGRDSRGRSRSRSRDRDRHRGHRSSRDRSYSRSSSKDRLSSKHSTENLLEKVLKSEREAATAVGRNYAQRPASYKGSLSMKADRYTARRKSPSPYRSSRSHRRSRSRSPRRDSKKEEAPRSSKSNTSRSYEASIEQINKMKMLKAKYGDASANN